MATRKRLDRLGPDERGGAIVEFAIVVPVLLLVLLGAVEFGRMFYVRQGLEYATESAARYYSMNSSASTSTVTSYLQSLMVGGKGSAVTVSYTNTANCNGNTNVTCTTITAAYTFSFAERYLGFSPKTLTTSSQAVRY